ncbi:MAG: hypothetical protein IPK83_24640, partial [Planctomycetes bacterium]|nr:hypothetical protein [Planctomycetota bacterium]
MEPGMTNPSTKTRLKNAVGDHSGRIATIEPIKGPTFARFHLHRRFERSKTRILPNGRRNHLIDAGSANVDSSLLSFEKGEPGKNTHSS